VVGGGFGYLRTASQSLVATELTPLRSPPFPPGTEGLRVTNGSTTGNLYTAAVLLAKRFGKHDKSSLGVSVERIFSANGLTESIAETSGALSWDQQLSSRSLVHRSRITVGIKHDFHGVKFGAFYRYGVGSGKEFDRSRLVNGVAQPNDITKSRGTTSELGFRIRGFFSPRFYYGAEASFFLGQTRESIRRSVITDSTQRDHTFRSTLGFGLGYVVSPRTILSFDIAGGMVDLRQTRIEDLTHHTLETEKARGRFLSLHAAIQIDVWRNAFLSASILSIMQSHNSFMTFFPDRFGRTLNAEGVPSVGGSSKDLFTDIYSNYGAGWRLRPNVIFQYILSTDYGQTDIRHTFLLRYTIGGKK